MAVTLDQVHQGLLTLQRILRRARMDALPGKDALLPNLLPYFITRKRLRPAEIGSFLSIPFSNVARLNRKMEVAGIARTVADKSDGRGKVVVLTERGVSIARTFSLLDVEIADSVLGSLTVRQKEQLTTFFRALADALAEPEYPFPEFVTPLVRQQSRLAGALGMFGKSEYLDSGLGIIEYQLFNGLASSSSPIRLTELYGLVPLELGTLSRLVGRFGKSGELRKIRSKGDGREVFLSLTKKGSKHFQGAKEKAISKLRPALQNISAKALEQFVAISRIVEDTARVSSSVQEEVRCRRPRDRNDWVRIRAFLVDALSYTVAPRRAGAILISENTPVLIAENSAQQIVGVSYRQGQSRWRSIVKPQVQAAAICERLIAAVRECSKCGIV